MDCFPIPQISNKATKTEASGGLKRQTRLLTPSSVSGERRWGTGSSLIWLVQCSAPESKSEQYRLRRSQRWRIQQRPGTLTSGLVLTYHLSPFINNYLPQEWPISKAIPSSLAFHPAGELRSRGKSLINAEQQAGLSPLASVSFSRLIKI